MSQKLSRDAFAEYTKAGGRPCTGWSPEEVAACGRVAGVMRAEAERGVDRARAWDAAWRDVYALAAAVCDRVMGEWTTAHSPLGDGVGVGGVGVGGVAGGSVTTVTARRARM